MKRLLYANHYAKHHVSLNFLISKSKIFAS